MSTQPQTLESTAQIQTKFQLELPLKLARTLLEWFKETKDGHDLERFAEEVFALPLIERRRQRLPPTPESSMAYIRINAGGASKLSEAQKDDLLELWDGGLRNTSTLAERFTVSKGTIRRELRKGGRL